MKDDRSADDRLYASIAGKRILIVEDRYLVAHDLSELLTDCGAKIIGIASNLEDGIVHAHVENVDLALLDVDLRGESVFKVADILDERGIAYIFATGLAQSELPARFQSRRVIRKPFADRMILSAIDAALTGSLGGE